MNPANVFSIAIVALALNSCGQWPTHSHRQANVENKDGTGDGEGGKDAVPAGCKKVVKLTCEVPGDNGACLAYRIEKESIICDNKGE